MEIQDLKAELAKEIYLILRKRTNWINLEAFLIKKITRFMRLVEFNQMFLRVYSQTDKEIQKI